MRLRMVVWAALAATLVPGAAADAGRHRGNCPGARTSPAHAKRFLRAVLCLQGVERRKHGLGSLRLSRRLDRAAMRHARDMVRRRYFGHISPAGSDPLGRARDAGYRGARRTTVGENLLSWTAPLTPVEVLKRWMASPPHRSDILGRWRDVGAAVITASPSSAGGITVVVEFGRRT